MMNPMWRSKSLAWTNELSVGNGVIDAEHKNLIGLANDVVDAIKARDYDDMAQAFEMLNDWIVVHFLNEEQIARAVGFDFEKHKLAQQYCLDELRFLSGELVGCNSLWCKDTVEHITHFLRKWIIDDHIIGLDMQMRPVLQKYEYSFWPNRECDKPGLLGKPALVPVSLGPPDSLQIRLQSDSGIYN